MALPFPVINETFQGSLTLHGSRDFPVPGLGAYHRQIRQLPDRLDRLSLAVESGMLTSLDYINVVCLYQTALSFRRFWLNLTKFKLMMK